MSLETLRQAVLLGSMAQLGVENDDDFIELW